MPRTEKLLSLLKRWSGPTLVIVIGLLFFSLFVSGIRCLRTGAVRENFQDQMMRKYPVAKVEKARDILPYLYVYLLSTHPQREWMTTSDGDEVKKHHKKHVWEDLGNYRNDFQWQGGMNYVDQSGFHTLNRPLTGPGGRNLNMWQSGEFTLILRSQSLAEENQNKAHISQVTAAEVVQNAWLYAEGEKNLMTINVPVHGEIKTNFNHIVTCLTAEKQDKEMCSELHTYVKAVQDDLNKLPHHGRKDMRSPVAVVIPGNEKNALVLRLPQNYSPIEVEVNGKIFKTDKNVNSGVDTYYSLTYRGTSLSVYQDGVHLNTFTVPRMYFNDEHVRINPAGYWNANLQDVAMLNKHLTHAQLALFRQKGLVLKAILEQHQNRPVVPGLLPPPGCVSCTGLCECPDIGSFNPYMPHKQPKHPDKCKCTVSCDCPNGGDPFGPYDPNCPGNDPANCPPVTMDENGNFLVEGVNYGNSRKVAREIYMINYPNCRSLPDELRYGYERENANWRECPFVVRSALNPCAYPSCRSADWNASQPDRANLNGRCRRRIDAYCDEHNQQDEFCACWRPENWDVPNCRTFRANFSNPEDRGCDITDYNIEEHPDMDKYIRKDNIPCWGCDLEQSSGRSYCPVECRESQSVDGPGLKFNANVSLATSKGDDSI